MANGADIYFNTLQIFTSVNLFVHVLQYAGASSKSYLLPSFIWCWFYAFQTKHLDFNFFSGKILTSFAASCLRFPHAEIPMRYHFWRKNFICEPIIFKHFVAYFRTMLVIILIRKYLREPWGDSMMIPIKHASKRCHKGSIFVIYDSWH